MTTFLEQTEQLLADYSAMIIVWAMADVGARFIAPLGRDESRPYLPK